MFLCYTIKPNINVTNTSQSMFQLHKLFHQVQWPDTQIQKSNQSNHDSRLMNTNFFFPFSHQQVVCHFLNLSLLTLFLMIFNHSILESFVCGSDSNQNLSYTFYMCQVSPVL